MAFAKITTQDPMLNRIQDSVAAEFGAIEAMPANHGQRLVTALIGVSDTAVYHTLGKPIQGYIVVRANVAANVFDGTTSSAPAKYVTLRASTPVTAKLLFF